MVPFAPPLTTRNGITSAIFSEYMIVINRWTKLTKRVTRAAIAKWLNLPANNTKVWLHHPYLT